MEKNQTLDEHEELLQIQAMMKALPNEAGAVGKDDLYEIFSQEDL
jgi:hypothetical protein